LFPRKGCISIGADADLTIIDMNLEKPIRAEELLSAQDHTPFEGFITKGWSTQTIIRGRVMFDNGKVTDEKRGEFIKRPTALH
jgi:dihydroorotase-like cyclic amidohydrolase